MYAAQTVRFGVLGPLEVIGPDGYVPVTGRNERAVLAALLAWADEVVSTDRLFDAVWGERPPRSGAKVLQNVILRLRKLLGAPTIETRPDGYVLRAAADAIDVRCFERLVADGRVRAGKHDPFAAAAAFSAALDLWRGSPLPELYDWPPARSEAARLDELRRCVDEELADVQLACGHHHEWVPTLETLVADEPLRERRWGLLMLALYRCGRQADAMRTFQRARAALDEIGLEPGPEVVRLEQRIGGRDASLDLVATR